MLEPLKHILNSKRIVLASSSIRRKQILEAIDFKFEICTSECEENLDKKLFHRPCDYALATASLKSADVARRLRNEKPVPPIDLIIGADTVVSCDDNIFEKPKDERDAINMLKKLSARTHTVYTGVVLIQPEHSNGSGDPSGKVTKFHVATDVVFDQLSDDVIAAYVKTGEPLDKAGGYGIQRLGGTFVKEIRGDYNNVVGFPLHQFCKELIAIYTK